MGFGFWLIFLLPGKQQSPASQTSLVFDLPPATPHFFGRHHELDILHNVLDPAKPSMKGIVLYGLAGSGKTQLVLNFIETHKSRYTSVLWINASSKEATSQSFANIQDMLEEVWPSRDLPNPIPRGASSEKAVLSRLRSTMYKKWLLIIDSADDVETTNFASLVPPRCPHGSVIVTSTRRSASDQFEAFGFASREIDSLDDQSASQLLLFASSTQREPDNRHNESGMFPTLKHTSTCSAHVSQRTATQSKLSGNSTESHLHLSRLAF